MISSDSERQAPVTVDAAEPTHLARYEFALGLLSSDQKVLDIPCGSGYGTKLLASKAQHVVGVDVSAEAIQHAKEFFQTDNNEFFVHDALSVSEILVQREPFDVIVSFEGIEHLTNPSQFLEQARKCLAPNGTLIISTPRKPHGSPHHIIEFTLEEFKEVLSKEFIVQSMYGQIYTDIFNMDRRKEDPNAYKKFNFIAVCTLK